MCGIAGIYKINKSSVSIEDLKKMTDAIIHRGPDGEGFWLNEKETIGFGHRRLAIIDLSENGKQPMHYAESRYTLTFNGEIYNYIELKEQLLKKGYKFKSESDTEVLLALYDLKKEKCLDDLDGMFAFAIWDKKDETLFCARDRFGEKPFYYHYKPGGAFIFASEMKALWAAGVPKENDIKMTNLFLKTGRVLDPDDLSKTFYKNILQLNSAHYLKIDTKGLNINRYYDIKIAEPDYRITRKEASEKFYSLLENSVKLRLRSDVAVGSSLSGGLDSSSIVMLIDKLKGNSAQQNTFSARFEGFIKDEGKYIHEVVDACKNVVCHEVWPNNEQLENDLKKLCYHQEEPFGSASIFAQWKVMELAKQKETIVLLDGQGADEYLGGYLYFYSSYLNQLFINDRSKYVSEIKAYNSLRGNTMKRKEEEETLRMKLGRYKRKILNQPSSYSTTYLKEELKKCLLHDSVKSLLRFADRNSMAHSREVRLPFLSHPLIEFVFSLPDDFLLTEGWTKWILRESMKNTLPDNICWRVDKIGYEPPQDKWLANNPYWKDQIATGKTILNKLATGKPETYKTDDWQLIMISKYFAN